MGKVEDQIKAQNGAFFAVYTGTSGMSETFSKISPYMKGSYFTGKQPSINIPYTPFVAVIDMETGKVIDKDKTQSDYMMPNDVVAACTTANSD